MKWGAAPRNHLSLSLTLPLYQFPSLCLSLSLSLSPPFWLALSLTLSRSLPLVLKHTDRCKHTHTLFLSLFIVCLSTPFPLCLAPFSLLYKRTHTHSSPSVFLSLSNLTPPHPFSLSLSSLHWLELHRGTLILPVQKGHHHQRQGTSTESPKSQSFLQRMTRM